MHGDSNPYRRALTFEGLSHPDANLIKVYASIQWTGLRETESKIVALDKTGSEVLVEIEGAKTTAVASAESATKTELVMTNLCHDLDCKPDMDLLSNDQVQALCDSSVSDTLKTVNSMPK